MAALGAFIALAQWREFHEVTAAEREHLLTQVRVADQVLHTQIQSADAALRTMLESLDRWRGPDGYLPFAHEHLKRVEKMMPGARTFAVLNAQGRCELSNRPELIGMDLSSRSYFKHTQEDPVGHMLHIAPPYRTVLGVWTVTISRAIFDAQGRYAGAVVATISPEYFEALMKGLRYAPDVRLSLLHDEGQLYVTSPPNGSMLSADFSKPGNFFSAHMQSRMAETHHTGEGFDGLQRMAVARTVALEDINSSHRFVAVAGREIDAMYAPWRMTTGVLFAIWLSVLVLSGLALRRYASRARELTRRADEAQEATRRSNARFEQIASTIPCVLFDFEVAPGGDVRVLYVGPYAHTLLGRAPQDFLATPGLFLRCLLPDDATRLRDTAMQAVAQGGGFNCEVRLHDASGPQRWLRMTATAAATAQAPGATHFSGFLVDITDTKTHQLVLHEMAYRDPLTQADNRRSFTDKLEAERQRVHRFGTHSSVIMLDIDFFKHVNDTYGHDVGDAVLQHLATVLRACLREVDTLARLGGEEFAVLLPETPLESAALLAERLRQAVQATPSTAAGHTVPFTISLGVAVLHDAKDDTKAVLKRADDAMYQAKHSGRNRVCCEEE